MQREIVTAQRAAVAVEEFVDSARRQLAVLECARNALAHQRIDPGRVAREDHASASIAVARVEPSDRERMPSRRVPRQSLEWKFGKRRDEFRYHPRLFAARFDEFVRTLIVNAYVKMRCTADQARKRPAVAIDSAAHTSEVEAIASLEKFGRTFMINCDIRHQGAPDRLLASAEYRATHPAARSISADEDLSLEDAAICSDSHVARILNNVQHATALHDFDSRRGCGSRQHRIEEIAPNHGGEHVAIAR